VTPLTPLHHPLETPDNSSVYLYNNPTFKAGVNIALTRLNFEFSGNKNVSWVNDMPGVELPDFEFNQETAKKMEVVGGVKVGQRVAVEKAKHILIISTYRSGSSFLGDLLNHYPGSFYYFEPLHYLQHVYQGPKFPSVNTTHLLETLLKCEFHDNGMVGYLAHVSGKKLENRHLLSKNSRLWNSCVNQLPGSALCFSPEYLNTVCPLYPVKLVKTVRMPVKFAEPLLNISSLNLKIVILTRDPRGTYNSRSSLRWCGQFCSNVTFGCDNLLNDVTTAKELRIKYPGRIQLLRYEDLCVDPVNTTRTLLDFLSLPWVESISSFLQSHTSKDTPKVYVNKMANKIERRRNAYGTARNSIATAIAWKKEFGWDAVKDVQDKCGGFMDIMGYRKLEEEKELETEELPLVKTALEVWPKL